MYLRLTVFSFYNPKLHAMFYKFLPPLVPPINLVGNNFISELTAIEFDDLSSFTMDTSNIFRNNNDNAMINEIGSIAFEKTEKVSVAKDNQDQISANNIKKEQQTCLDQNNFNDASLHVEQSLPTNYPVSVSGETNYSLMCDCYL